MSDEEREIDVELDERENDDDLASLGGQYDNKRALHNAMERKRRDSIKDSFRGLQVPYRLCFTRQTFSCLGMYSYPERR